MITPNPCPPIGVQCPDAVTATLYQELELKCLLTNNKAAASVTWTVDGVEVLNKDLNYNTDKIGPSEESFGYVSLTVYNVTEGQVSFDLITVYIVVSST